MKPDSKGIFLNTESYSKKTDNYTCKKVTVLVILPNFSEKNSLGTLRNMLTDALRKSKHSLIIRVAMKEQHFFGKFMQDYTTNTRKRSFYVIKSDLFNLVTCYYLSFEHFIHIVSICKLFKNSHTPQKRFNNFDILSCKT